MTMPEKPTEAAILSHLSSIMRQLERLEDKVTALGYRLFHNPFQEKHHHQECPTCSGEFQPKNDPTPSAAPKDEDSQGASS